MSRRPVDFSRLRILLAVENHGLMRQLLHEMLRGFGVPHIEEARSWDRAMDRARRAPFDAAIVDSILGNREGADLVRALRRDPTCRNRQMPILLMAAAPDPESVAKALMAGIDDMLAKPIAPKDLHARLSAALGSPRSFVVTPDYAGPMRRRRSRALAALHETPRPPRRPGAVHGAARRPAGGIVGLDDALFV